VFAQLAIDATDEALRWVFPFRRACGGNGRGYRPAARNRSLYERMIMSGLTPELPYHNGNGAQHHVPRSRRAFLKAAPARIAFLEDQIEGLEICLETIAKALASKAEDPRTVAVEARVNNLAEIVAVLAGRVRIIDRRSARTRRRALALADQLAF
jgi:hypothetical protein